MTVIPLAYEEDIYPESDGQPMAETDLHRDELTDAVAALKTRYEREGDVYVSGNLLFYYEQGNPRRVVSPDVFVVRGVRKGPRRKYLLWKEGRGPCFVIELTSESTKGEDLETKRDLYQRLGVEEHFLFDPQSESLRPPLQGFRLINGRYRPIKPESDGSLRSRTTDLLLRQEGQHLRLTDATTGEPLLRNAEWASVAKEEKARADREAARAAVLEQELERLRRELRQDS